MNQEFENIIDSMETNGYAYYNKEAFLNKTNKVCYVPENAEKIEECYTYWDLYQLCLDYCDENQDYPFTPSELVINMYDNLEWVFPETWLNELNNY